MIDEYDWLCIKMCSSLFFAKLTSLCPFGKKFQIWGDIASSPVFFYLKGTSFFRFTFLMKMLKSPPLKSC